MMSNSLTDVQRIFEQIKPLAKMFPTIFPAWQVTFMNAYMCGELSPRSSFSLLGRRDVDKFRSFILPRVSGRRVVDIGSGPTKAGYLNDVKCDSHSIDPLSDTGIAECLNAPSTDYAAAIFATSLDHVCHVPTAIQEASKVLTKDGCILVWSNQVAPPRNHWVIVDDVYYHAPLSASDPFHLRQLGLADVRMEMNNQGFKLTRQDCKKSDQCFQEYSRC